MDMQVCMSLNSLLKINCGFTVNGQTVVNLLDIFRSSKKNRKNSSYNNENCEYQRFLFYSHELTVSSVFFLIELCLFFSNSYMLVEVVNLYNNRKYLNKNRQGAVSSKDSYMLEIF